MSLLGWTLIIVTAVFVTSWAVLRGFINLLWGKGQPANYNFGRDGSDVFLQLRSVVVAWSEASKLKTLRVSLLELRVPNYFKARSAAALRVLPTVTVHGVAVATRYDTLPDLHPTPQLYVTPLLSWVGAKLLYMMPSVSIGVTLKHLTIDYPVKGVYTSRIVIEELHGKGTLLPCVSATFQAAKGRLEVGGIPIANYTCETPSLQASYDQGGAVIVTVRGAQTQIEPCEKDVAMAVAKAPADVGNDKTSTTANNEGAAQAADKLDSPQDKGFDISASSFTFEYSAAAVDVKTDDLAVSFKAGSLSAKLRAPLTMSEVVSMASRSNGATNIVPLRLARAGIHYEFNGPVASDPAPLTGDDFEVIDTADSLAARAASGSVPPVPSPEKSVPSFGATASVGKSGDSKGSSSGVVSSPPAHHESPAVAGPPAAAMATAVPALVLTADSMTVNILQQEHAFEQMSAAAEQLLSNGKAMLARVAKRTAEGAARDSKSVTTVSGPTLTINAKIDDVSVRIDNSTVKVATLTYGGSAGLLATEVDIQVVNIVPVMSCRMNSFHLQTGGVMAVEGLALEAGKLGKLLLFKLLAQGVGYTAEAREMVLVTWSTELGGAKVMGGERWSGVLETTTDGTEGAPTQRVVRRIVVPPGVQLTQVFRLAQTLPAATVEKEPLQKGLVTLRPLDTAAVKAPAVAAQSSLTLKIPPAGFGLDILPGFKAGLCFDFAVQSLVVPGLPTREQGLAAAASIFKAVLRR